MKYNLHSDNSLPYPHHTKIENDEIYIVADYKNPVQVGDTIFAASYGTTFLHEKKIKVITEERTAKGQHKINAIFQRCKF